MSNYTYFVRISSTEIHTFGFIDKVCVVLSLMPENVYQRRGMCQNEMKAKYTIYNSNRFISQEL